MKQPTHQDLQPCGQCRGTIDFQTCATSSAECVVTCYPRHGNQNKKVTTWLTGQILKTIGKFLKYENK